MALIPLIWLQGQAGGVMEQSGGVALAGAVGASLGPVPSESVGLVAGVGESVVLGSAQKSVGTVRLYARYPAGPAEGARLGGPWIGAGFSHQHELSIEAANADPLASAIGVHPDIDHRSGLLGAAGWDGPSLGAIHPLLAPFSPTAALTVHALVADDAPPLAAFAEVGVKLRVR